MYHIPLHTITSLSIQTARQGLLLTLMAILYNQCQVTACSGLTSRQYPKAIHTLGFVGMVPQVRRRLRSKANDGATSRGRSKTINWDELEDWQKDNEYILRGYRR
jgi:hypothetical protein